MLFGLTQISTNPGNFNSTAIYDPLQITLTTVPEPSTWAMTLAGFAGLGWLARTRGRKTSLA
jgi:PEP-CTERM motif